MQRQARTSTRQPIGILLLAAFFAFGVMACTVTIIALVSAGGAFDAVWRLNPETHAGFQQIGTLWSVGLMTTVGMACAGAAVGLAKGRAWGRRLAIGILAVNLIGDAAGAAVRRDPRTLIGLPIGGAMVAYLWRHQAAETPPRAMP